MEFFRKCLSILTIVEEAIFRHIYVNANMQSSFESISPSKRYPLRENGAFFCSKNEELEWSSSDGLTVNSSNDYLTVFKRSIIFKNTSKPTGMLSVSWISKSLLW